MKKVFKLDFHSCFSYIILLSSPWNLYSNGIMKEALWNLGQISTITDAFVERFLPYVSQQDIYLLAPSAIISCFAEHAEVQFEESRTHRVQL